MTRVRDVKRTFAKDDLLKREPFAKMLLNLIEKEKPILQDNDSLVIAIDAPWGTGKTMFLEMFDSMLEEKDNISPVYYNAWENDDYGYPLLSILHGIIKNISDDNNDREEVYHKGVEILKRTGINVAKNIVCQVVKNKFGVDAKEVVDIIQEEMEKDFVNTFEKYENAITEKNDLIYMMKEKTSDGKKIIVLIDELDRCRPTYAIELLETVKHYLNVENYIFVFALDAVQLAHSISTQYGHDMDANGYLRRFFDYTFSFPLPYIKDYCKKLFISVNLKEPYKTSFIEDIIEMAKSLELSLRDLSLISRNFIIIWESVLDSQIYSHYMLEAYLGLIAEKYKNPKVYNFIFESRGELPYRRGFGSNIMDIAYDYVKLHVSHKPNGRKTIEGNAIKSEYIRNDYKQVGDNYAKYFVDSGHEVFAKLYDIDEKSEATVGEQLSYQLQMIDDRITDDKNKKK